MRRPTARGGWSIALASGAMLGLVLARLGVQGSPDGPALAKKKRGSERRGCDGDWGGGHGLPAAIGAADSPVIVGGPVSTRAPGGSGTETASPSNSPPTWLTSGSPCPANLRFAPPPVPPPGSHSTLHSRSTLRHRSTLCRRSTHRRSTLRRSTPHSRPLHRRPPRFTHLCRGNIGWKNSKFS